MTKARSVPVWLAAVLQELELERPALVRVEDVGRIAAKVGAGAPTALIVKGLADRLWLLPTGARGVWEFVPGARAGGLSSGSPFYVLLAIRAKHPGLAASIALESALWQRNLLDRAPEPSVVVLPPGVRPPVGLRRAYRLTWFDMPSGSEEVAGVPTQTLDATLLHLAAKPTDVQNWGAVLEALATIVSEVDRGVVEDQLTNLGHATQARLSYLVSGVSPEWAESLGVPRRGVVRFGPRDRAQRRYNGRWNVQDTVLPHDPAELRA
jgi:hypothetical protein